MVRVGVVGFDTSHAVEFTKRINHVGISEDQWVDGARIVIGYPGEPSNFADEALISKRTQQIRDFGVEIVDSAEDIIGKVDAVMLESQEGGLHLEAAKPFLEAGLPLFIDKPFTCSVSDAEKIAETAKAHGVPVFSSSSLRYALEIQSLKTKVEKGDVLGVDVYSPAYLDPHNPGLFNYGVHGVEILYSLMGPGCGSVVSVWDERWETVVGRWKDGRIGTFRGIRKGVPAYGFAVFYEKEVVSSAVDARYIYRELLKKVVEMFQTRKAPVPIEETVEIMAFIEASLKSAEEGSAEQKVGT